MDSRSRRVGSVIALAGVSALFGLFLLGIPAVSTAQAGGPTVRVRLNDFPEMTFGPGSPWVRLFVQAGQAVTIDWDATPDEAGESIARSRHGWNIRNPDNDEEWEQDWCVVCPAILVRTFHAGTQRFFLEVEDSAGDRTRAEIEVVIVQVGVESTSWTAMKRHLLR